MPRPALTNSRFALLSGAVRSPSLPLHRFLSSTRIARSEQSTSTADQGSIIVSHLRTDLKAALRSKNKPLLYTIRSILADISSSSSTPLPITTDTQIMSRILRKRIGISHEAITGFQSCGRTDLIEKEEAEITVLEKYVQVGIDAQGGAVDPDQLESIIRDVVTQLKAEADAEGGKLVMGQVLKVLFAEGGKLDGKPVDRKEIAVAVKRIVG